MCSVVMCTGFFVELRQNPQRVPRTWPTWSTRSVLAAVASLHIAPCISKPRKHVPHMYTHWQKTCIYLAQCSLGCSRTTRHALQDCSCWPKCTKRVPELTPANTPGRGNGACCHQLGSGSSSQKAPYSPEGHGLLSGDLPQHLGCILAKESPLPASWRCRLGRYCKVASLTDRVLAQV